MPARPPYDFEVLVKSFIRFDKLLTLVASIRRHYPGVTIRIADDSPDSAERDAARRSLEALGGCVFYPLPPDVGISVGRNLLVRQVETPHFVLTDDDKVFTRRTKLERLRAVLEADPACVIAAGMNLDYGVLLRYQHGRVYRRGDVVHRELFGDRAPTTTVGGMACVPCTLTPNFYMASTGLFRRHGIAWDERFKLGDGEHFLFFCDLPPDLHVYVVPSVRVSHFPTRWGHATYRRFRFNPRETGKIADVARLRVDTTKIYESRLLAWRERLQRLVRRAIDRVVLTIS